MRISQAPTARTAKAVAPNFKDTQRYRDIMVVPSIEWIRRGVYGWLIASAAAAQSPTPAANSTPSAPATAALAPTLVKGADGSLAIAVRFTISPHWHIYWSNPGDSGGPTRVSVTLPKGWTAGPMNFPRPKILGTAEDRSFGYATSVEFRVPVTSHPMPLPPSVDVSASVDWLVCKESCLLGHAELKGTLDTAPSTATTLGTTPPMPTPLPAAWKVEVEGTGDERLLEVSATAPLPAGATWLFIPDDCPGITFSGGTGPFAPQSRAGSNSIIWRIPFEIQPENIVGGVAKIRGLVLAGTEDSEPCHQIEQTLKNITKAPAKGAN